MQQVAHCQQQKVVQQQTHEIRVTSLKDDKTEARYSNFSTRHFFLLFFTSYTDVASYLNSQPMLDTSVHVTNLIHARIL